MSSKLIHIWSGRALLFKVLFVADLLLVLSVAATGGAVFGIARGAIEEQITEAGKQEVATLARTAELELLDDVRGPHNLRLHVDNLFRAEQEERIVSVVIWDHRGIPQAQKGADQNSTQTVPQVTNEPSVVWKHAESIGVAVAVTYAGTRLGTVQMSFSRVAVRRAGHKILMGCAAIIALAVLANILVLFFLLKGLLRPVANLATALREFAGGGTAIRLAPGVGTDEIANAANSFNEMCDEIEKSRLAQAEQEALEREMMIAQQIQTALLPRNFDLSDFDIFGRMETAEMVGGDYFDVLCPDGKLWLGIGDVSSHGVTPGLIMLMAQSAIGSLTTQNPNAPPGEVFSALNRLLFDNIRNRLQTFHHMTLTLLRSEGDGEFRFAGAHLDIAIRRYTTGAVSFSPTGGSWIGVLPDVTDMAVESTLKLEPGDIMVLYTDGVTEAANAEGEMFEMEGLAACLAPDFSSAKEACDTVMEAVSRHTHVQDDDVTVLVLRRRPL